MNRIYIFIFIFFNCNLSYSQNDSIISNSEYKKFTFPNGNISSEGSIKNNFPVGFWISYYVTGVKKSEGKWLNNKLDSIWIFYDQIGDTLEKINYYMGKKNGYYYKYFKDREYKNIISSTELYIDGKRNDKVKYYYETGQLKKIIPFVDDQKHGIGFEYDRTGNPITVIRYRNNETLVIEQINTYNSNNRKDGLWKEFYSNGVVKNERTYLDGNLNGYVKTYDSNGELQSAVNYVNGEINIISSDFENEIEIRDEYDDNQNLIFQGSYRNNLPMGIHRYFDKEGNVIKSKTYDIHGLIVSEGIVKLSGAEDKEWILFYDNQQKRAEGNYNNGNKNGAWKYYYFNGSIQQTGSYYNGKFTGKWQWYYDTGELLKEEYYINGKLDGESIEYSKLGEIISMGSYIEGYKEGEWIYLIGDEKSTGKYSMGLKDGLWKSYYISNGNKSFEGRYIQGNADGKHRYFYPNQSLKEEQFYNEGEQVNSWVKYKADGGLIIVVQYRNGIEYKINGIKVKLNTEIN